MKVLVASRDLKETPKFVTVNGVDVDLVYGDFSPFLGQVVKYL